MKDKSISIKIDGIEQYNEAKAYLESIGITLNEDWGQKLSIENLIKFQTDLYLIIYNDEFRYQPHQGVMNDEYYPSLEAFKNRSHE